MSNTNQAKDEETQFDISESAYKTTHTAVRKARRFAMQGLYEWLMTDHRFEQSGLNGWKANAPHDIAARTRATNAMHTVHLGYYHEMMRHIPEQIEELDALIGQHLDRDMTLLDPVEHAILLIGAYELKYRLEIPYKVVLDEAMKLNTHFGATDAHKLINAVLDKLAPELRALEVAADEKLPKAALKEVPATDNESKLSVEDVAATHDNAASSNIDTGTDDYIETPKRNAKPRIGRKTGQPVKRKRVPPSSVKEQVDEERQKAAKDQMAQDQAASTAENTSLQSALIAAGSLQVDSEQEETANSSPADENAKIQAALDSKKPDAE